MSKIALRYTIEAGDSYSKIALELKKCANISTQQIQKANPGMGDGVLHEGQGLTIPDPSGSEALTYRVQAGDTVESIATGLRSASGVSYQVIEAANPGHKATSLQIGEVIDIPANGSGAGAVTPPADPPPPSETKPTHGSGRASATPAEIIGYWDWTWDHRQPVPGATLGIAFSGWSNIKTAIQQSASLKGRLAGVNYIGIGGGNDNGAFSSAVLTSVVTAINDGSFEGYDGIAFDIEKGDPGLAADFATTFAAAQKAGFKVLVTISHSAPFGITDAATVMKSFFESRDIDILSPQLYRTGEEAANNYAISRGVEWSAYVGCIPKVAPSIVAASYYASAQSFFKQQNVPLQGYIQWSRMVEDDAPLT